jgi:VWFA-related protein
MSKPARVVLAFTSLLFVLGATPPQIPSLGETMEVSIVNVDVVVTDRAGKRVRGLTRDDFEIFDNGVKQQISNFAEYTSGDVTVSASPRSEVSAPPPQKRTVVLFLERMRLPSFEAESFVAGIRRSLQAIVRPGDSVALVFWSRGRTLRVDGLEKVDAMLGGIARDFIGAEVDDLALARQLVAEAAEFEEEAADFRAEQGLGGTEASTDDGTDSALEILRMRAWSDMVARVGAIDAAISSIAAEEGKKILILAPRALGDVVVPPLTNERPTDPWVKAKYGTDKLMRPVLENANASGVTIYTLFAPRIRVGVPDATTREAQNPVADQLRLLNESVSLGAIAAKTGGLFAMSVSDAIKLLPRIEEDVTDYYSLAFRGDGKPGDRVRNIVVKAKSADYDVRSRRQYVEKTDKSRMHDRVIAALAHEPADRFDITAKTGPVAKARGRETVPLSIRIPVDALTLVPERGRRAGAFSVFVVAGSSEGTTTDVIHKVQPFEISDAQVPRDGHFTYTLDVVIDKRMDRLAVGVLDEVSKEFALLRVPIAK